MKYLLASIMIAGFILWHITSVPAQSLDNCPAGSYSIGDGICKQQPTGCAYGDSIPLGPECDKAKAEQDAERKHRAKKHRSTQYKMVKIDYSQYEGYGK